MSNTVVYLAGPITSRTPDIYLERIRLHAKHALELESMHGNLTVYSPACETHGYVELGGKIGTTWKDWKKHDLDMLSRCDVLMILMIPGWRESIGVRGEVKFALKNNIPIEFVAPEGSMRITTDVLEMFEIETAEELND